MIFYLENEHNFRIDRVIGRLLTIKGRDYDESVYLYSLSNCIRWYEYTFSIDGFHFESHGKEWHRGEGKLGDVPQRLIDKEEFNQILKLKAIEIHD